MNDSAVNAMTSTIGVPPRGEREHAAPGILDPSATMVVLTWLVFGLLSLVLYKVAWKPILGALDTREKSIRDSLDAAGRARAELADIEERSQAMLAEARRKSEEIVSAAHETAGRVGAAIEREARERSKNMLEAAEREIENATRRAREALRGETADLALLVAGKLVRGGVDSAAGSALARRLAEEMGESK